MRKLSLVSHDIWNLLILLLRMTDPYCDSIYFDGIKQKEVIQQTIISSSTSQWSSLPIFSSPNSDKSNAPINPASTKTVAPNPICQSDIIFALQKKYQGIVSKIRESRSKSSNFGLSHLQVQYKYVNKSPEYFKKKERSLLTLEPSPYHDTQPMQKYIDTKMKKFNKESLIDLARQGLYKNMNYRHRIIPKKKQTYNLYAQASNSMGGIKNETKYSSFNPGKIAPLMHSLKKVYPSCVIKK